MKLFNSKCVSPGRIVKVGRLFQKNPSKGFTVTYMIQVVRTYWFKVQLMIGFQTCVPPPARFLTLNCWVEAWILWLPDSKERKVRGGMMTDIEEKVGVRRWKMSTRQHNYREGLFKHVYLHPLHSVFSLRARGTSCCTLLPQKHTTVTHPALHPVLTKHSVTVSETSLSTFASYSMWKTELSHHQINRSQHQIFESRLRFMVQYIKGLERWYSITNTHIYPLIYFSAFLK